MTERGKRGVVSHAAGIGDFIADKNRLLKRYTFVLSEKLRTNPITIDIYGVLMTPSRASLAPAGTQNDPNL
jgi:hypothetical protein